MTERKDKIGTHIACLRLMAVRITRGNCSDKIGALTGAAQGYWTRDPPDLRAGGNGSEENGIDRKPPEATTPARQFAMIDCHVRSNESCVRFISGSSNHQTHTKLLG